MPLSGPEWVLKFPTSKSPDDLTEPLPPMAETTGAAVRCPHAAGRERPGHAGLGAAAADTPAGQLAGPVWVAA